MLISIYKLMRPKGWIKNAFILLPIFFAEKITDYIVLPKVGVAFISFCLISSSVYIINDIFDINEDRLHPQKRSRPLPSGAVSIHISLLFSILLGILSFTLCSILIDWKSAIYLMVYLIMNVLYSIGLKHIPVLDVFLISFGFIIRVAMGATVAQVTLSSWLVIMTFLLTLILAFGKRKDDVSVLIKTGHVSRKVVHGYNHVFLDVVLSMLSAIVIVAYILYCMSTPFGQGSLVGYLYLTSTFVIFGFLRYLQQILVEMKKADPTELLFSDRVLQLTVILWFVSIALIVYIKI